MAKTDYLENKILNHVLKNTTYTAPAAVYAALFTAAPSEAGGGTEVTGGSYARQAITFGSPSAGTVANSAIVSFTALPAATITYFGIFDASTAGNLLYYQALASTITSLSGTDVSFAIGNLTVTED